MDALYYTTVLEILAEWRGNLNLTVFYQMQI